MSEYKFTISKFQIVKIALTAVGCFALMYLVYSLWPIHLNFWEEPIVGIIKGIIIFGASMVSLALLSALKEHIKSLSCHTVLFSHNQITFIGLWSKNTYFFSDFKEYIKLGESYKFILHAGTSFYVGVDNFKHAEQLTTLISTSIKNEAASKPKFIFETDKRVNQVLGLSEEELKMNEEQRDELLMAKRFDKKPEEVRVQNKEAKILQLLLIIGSVVGATLFLPILFIPYIILLVLKKRKGIFHIFPKQGYYSLIGPILVNAVTGIFLNQSEILKTSIVTWALALVLGFAHAWTLVKLEDDPTTTATTQSSLKIYTVLTIAMAFFYFHFACLANTILDYSDNPKQVAVTDKYVAEPMEGTTRYIIETTGFDDFKEITTQVPSRFDLDKIAIGDSVILHIGDGLLGSPWIIRKEFAQENESKK